MCHRIDFRSGHGVTHPPSGSTGSRSLARSVVPLRCPRHGRHAPEALDGLGDRSVTHGESKMIRGYLPLGSYQIALGTLGITIFIPKDTLGIEVPSQKVPTNGIPYVRPV